MIEIYPLRKKDSFIKSIFLFFILLFLSSCQENQSIVNSVGERDANEIIVYLATKGIEAKKIKVSTGGAVGAAAQENLWNISVASHQSIESMALLNQVGLPRRRGTTLLELFAKQGLMTSDREESIRYQAGIEEELKNIIRKIDGVIDAEVQISFPSTDETLLPGQTARKVKAAVYVKHQGVFDDPNNHLETKIRRLVAGSIDGLDYESVAVISDRARLTDLSLLPDSELISPDKFERDYVSIWSVMMTQGSSNRFRFIFFTLLFIILLFGGALTYILYRFYPLIMRQFKEKQLNKKGQSAPSPVLTQDEEEPPEGS